MAKPEPTTPSPMRPFPGDEAPLRQAASLAQERTPEARRGSDEDLAIRRIPGDREAAGRAPRSS